MNPIIIWKNRNQIVEGIKNSIFKNEHVEEIANVRKSVCENCDFIDRGGSKCVIPGTQPCCGSCGCSLHLKVRSLSSGCPEGYWKAILTEKEEEEIKKSL